MGDLKGEVGEVKGTVKAIDKKMVVICRSDQKQNQVIAHLVAQHKMNHPDNKQPPHPAMPKTNHPIPASDSNSVPYWDALSIKAKVMLVCTGAVIIITGLMGLVAAT